MDGIIVVNGEFYEPKSASIPAMDRGFLFGDNVFEVFVAFGAKVLDLDKHLERLRLSADLLDLPIPWSDDELKFELNALVERLPFKKSYLRLVVTRGCGVGLDIPEEIEANKFIYGLPARQMPAEYYANGVRLKLVNLPHTERKAIAKTGNYLRSILALKEAKKEGYADVVWANSTGEVTEASTANLFFIGREGDNVVVVTPSLQSGLLKGITRQTIIDLLVQAKIPVHEEIVDHADLARFDEAFMCSTVKGLVPVASINQHQLHTSRPSSVFQHIKRLFHTWVACELGHYVDWNTGEALMEPKSPSKFI